MKVEKQISVTMRDGTRLFADIYLPDIGDSWPVLLLRTPYGEDLPYGYAEATEAGYVLVRQNVRGRNGSEGVFDILAGQKEDGSDTISWIREQSWCNGKIGLIGMSFCGATQWSTLVENSQGVVTAVPAVTGGHSDGFGFYRYGVVQLDVLLLWSNFLVGEECLDKLDSAQESLLRHLALTRQRLFQLMANLSAAVSEEDMLAMQEAEKAFKAASEEFLQQPLSDCANQIARYSPWVQHWLDDLENPEAEYWRSSDWMAGLERVSVPLLHVVGWNDIFVRGGLRTYAKLSARDDLPLQKLVIAPEHHAGFVVPGPLPIGEKVMPYDAQLDEWLLFKFPASMGKDVHRRWADYWLKGEANGIDEGAPISLYIQGENVWRDEWEWPLARTEYKPIYLHSEGQANSVEGNGVLGFDPTSDQDIQDHFVYNPADPVPSKGGTFLGQGVDPGIFEQAEVESRDDVLVYTSRPLEQDLEVTGPVVMKLWASTSAVDTDFTARLSDVALDGKSFGVCDGVTRLRFREDKPGLVFPGEVQTIEIELSPTSYLFRTGHRLRVQISSSNFPLFDPNPNTGKSLLTDPANEMKAATQTVFHEKSMPSHLLLPTIPRG